MKWVPEVIQGHSTEHEGRLLHHIKVETSQILDISQDIKDWSALNHKKLRG